MKKKTSLIKIYTLSHPYTDNVRYVGQTKLTLHKRLGKHIFESKNNIKKTHNHCWIKSLLNDGLKPKIELIDEVDSKDWVFWEQHYISLFKSWNCNLNNHTIGGEGRLGIEPWNKGTKGICKSNKTTFKIGNFIGKETRFDGTVGIKTRFQKGGIPYNKGKTHKSDTIEKMRKAKSGKISLKRSLTYADAIEIRKLRKDGLRIIKLANNYDVSESVISCIVNNKTYLK